jgi:hexosaminidase
MLKLNKYLLLLFTLVWAGFKTYGNDFPALIPMPQQVQWKTGAFSLKQCKYIWLKDTSLKHEALLLQTYLQEKTKVKVVIVYQKPTGTAIILSIAKVRAPMGEQEAYQLNVNNGLMDIKANTGEGVFRGLQTLYQLAGKPQAVQNCSITDFPAYSWRGYMVDVGRNYQSVTQLKKQIDMMGRYKLNIFHFHLTEDLAWRLEVKAYPQLTAAQNQIRNPGKYYSIEQVKDLINYCRERYITLVPEIDMPGHSAAFTRAMGAGMQTEKGLAAIKAILTEICNTYNVPYIHIGADEVVIKNKQFLPEVTTLLQQLHKKVIAWAPGGNYAHETIRQLWKDEGERDIADPKVRYIDSRSLYISDMDPLNTVATIFNRKLGNKTHGDSTMLGAEFCVWNDRKVTNESELVSRNAVYPAMLAFAERSWRGGGYELTFTLGADTTARFKAFAGFENRLLKHQQMYFSVLPFTYAKQTSIKWKLLGPFKNEGNLSATFWPEAVKIILSDSTGTQAIGGTVWLWHTNAPDVQSWLRNFNPNTTYYAYTRFYSANSTVLKCWIDFKDQSRSGADVTPPSGQWDYKQSKIWINHKQINAPKWQFPGKPKGLLEQPLVDESFYQRQPTAIKVKQGWNEVLIKLPMDNFDKKDWQVPPKWMFTFVPVSRQGANWQLYPTVFNPNGKKP